MLILMNSGINSQSNIDSRAKTTLLRGLVALWHRPVLRLSVGAAFLLAVIAMGLLVTVTDGKLENDAEMLDAFIALRSHVLTSIMGTATLAFSWYATIAFTGLVGLLLWLITRRWQDVAFVYLSQIAASALTHLMKAIIQRDRPPELLRLVIEADTSFPSGHTTAATALAISAAIVLSGHVRRRRFQSLIWVLALVIAMFIAVTRMYLAAHWFTDVTAGALVGTGSTIMLSAWPWLRQANYRATRPSLELQN
ncbi:MAG: phosphatase PAP2 family protein [Canibacter sp.]